MKPILLFTLLLFSATSLFAQIFGRNYNPGAYYTTDGQRHEGLLAMDFDPPSIFSSHPDNTLYFKPNDTTRRVKIKMSTLKAFVVTNRDTARTDSFVIVHQVERSRIKFEYDFILAAGNYGPFKLYQYRLQRKTGAGFGMGALMVGLTVTYYDYYYFYGENADNSVEIKRKTFKDVMSKLMADDPELVAMIQNKTYTIGDMETVLKIYNTKRASAAKK